ncbi:response regulator [Methylobacterium sp. J-068]|uniref:response regulator n=1 Tax=Methylobacterium sp. J-068 TaxID=2836649 RepID=UPI001FBA4277|nr:response regulator [Methylobacterium sp. J-068]MCJ2033434.1 response regulator [Methylobacterium sp. J-068]
MLAAPHQPLVVLLAGDELTRSLTTSCLEMSGYDVLGARTAGEVESLLLAQPGERRVDVLVTDADIRDTVDGLSLATVARCLDPAVGVVYTARSPRRLEGEALVPGALCLRTPYHGHQLVALIATLLAPSTPLAPATRRDLDRAAA